jgi:antitoxin YefM
MRAINYSEVRNNLASVLDDVVNDMEVTIVTRRGDHDGSRAVYMVPAAVWESMEETAYLLRGGNREHLARSVEQLRAGRLSSRTLVDPAPED